MPKGPSGRSHAFASSRDDAAITRALHIDAARTASQLTLRLTPVGVGHAFPTGDLFRRLAVRASLIGDDMHLVGEQTRYLARHFVSQPTTMGLRRTLLRDDRPGASVGSIDVTMSFDDASAKRIAWDVSYERVAHPAPGAHDNAVVAERVLIAEGVLAP